MKKYFALFVVCILALVSCEKEPVLTLSVDKIAVSSAGGSGSVVVNANNPWSVVGTDWCSASPSSGDGGEVTVTINVKENSTYESRNCTLVFASAGLTQSLQVSQDSNLGIVIPDDSYELSSAAQQISVEVKANVEYNVSVSADWIRLNGTKALSSKTYTFDVDANDTYGSRETVISIESRDGADVKQIKVKQVQNDAIVISTKEYGLSSAAQYIEVKLQTNVDIEVVTPSWISHVSTKALSDKILVLSVDANEGYSARDGEVIVKQKNSSLSDTIKVHQAQKDAIILSKREYELSSQAHTLEILLQTNIDIEVVVPDGVKEWITYVQTKSLNERTLVLAISENGTYGERSGEIYVKNSASGIEEVISILQHQNDAILLAQREYEVSCEAQQLDVALKTNVAVDVVVLESAAEWISHIQTKSLTDKIVSFAIKSNEGYDNRVGRVAVKAKNAEGGANVSDTLVITQLQKDAVIIKQKEYVVSSSAQALEIKLQANADIDVEIPESGKGWITYVKTKALSDKTVVLDIAENGTYDARECEIFIVNKANSAKYGVKITQVQNDAIVISKSEYKIGCEGGEIELEVAHNVEYSVSIEGDWITQVQTKGLVTDKLLFVVAENTISEARTGSVTFASKDGKLSQKITIEQDAKLFQLFYTSTDGNVVIPYVTSAWGDANIVSNVYENGQGIITFDKELTELPYRVFLNCSTLETITIPESVVAMGNSAFLYCSSLKDISIPSGISKIGDFTFDGCTSLESITIPETVTVMGGFVLRNCAKLGGISIPESVVEIGLHAFDGCVSLTDIVIPDGVKVIESCMFESCTSLKRVTLPDGLTAVNSYAFYLCSALESVVLPGSVTDIKEYAFGNCTSLRTVAIPESVTSIKWSAFTNCSKLESFTGKYATEDGRCLVDGSKLIAFAPKGITEYTVPDGVTSIGTEVFRGCYALSAITIPECVTEIGSDAFYLCSSLLKVFCKPVTPPALGNDAFFINKNGRKIYVPAESVSVYKTAKEWSEYADDIVGYDFENGIEVQPNNEIWYTSSDAKVVTPYSTSGFGANIVSNTYSNGKGVIVFDGEVTQLPASAFYSRTNLTSVSLPNSVTKIMGSALANTGLTEFTTPDGVLKIAAGAFARCQSLLKLQGKFASDDKRCLIVNGVLVAFAPSGLSSYTIPDNVLEIGESTFSNCPDIVSITLPQSVEKIRANAFYGCKKLSGVYCRSLTPSLLSGTSIFGNNASDFKIYVHKTSVYYYKERWSSYSYYICSDPSFGDNLPEPSFNESRYLLYKPNETGGWDAAKYNYRTEASHILCSASGVELEMKFKLSKVVGTYRIPIASYGNFFKDSYEEHVITDSYIYIEGKTLYWKDLGISPTDLISLRVSAGDGGITINGKFISCTVPANLFYGYLFASYGKESDEGVWEGYDYVPENSQLYYVRLYDANGNLSYLGYPAKAVNPKTGNEEYSWYSKKGVEEAYQFAHDSKAQGGYGGNF